MFLSQVAFPQQSLSLGSSQIQTPYIKKSFFPLEIPI